MRFAPTAGACMEGRRALTASYGLFRSAPAKRRGQTEPQ